MKTLRYVSLVLHRYLGLIVGAVMVVTSVTGSVLVFRHEIDAWLNPDLLHVTPRGETVSIDEVTASVRRTFPGDAPRLIQLPTDEHRPYKVWLAETGRHVFVDPYDGAVLGSRGEREGLMGWLFALHVDLLAGPIGSWIVGLSGFALFALILTGLVLWWPGWRKLWIALTVKWKRLNYDLHRAGGFWTMAFVALIALTGSGLVFYTAFSTVVSWVEGEDAAPPPTVSPSQASPVALSTALDEAQTALPGATPTFVYLPQAKGEALSLRFRMAGELHPNGRSFAYVHPNRGNVLRVDRALQASPGRQLLYALYPLHIGAFGGWIVRVLYAVLGLAPAVLTVTGVLIWYPRWKRKRERLRRGASSSLNRRADGNSTRRAAVRRVRDVPDELSANRVD